MRSISELWRGLDASLEGFLGRHPGLSGNLARYGWPALLALAALVVAGGVVFAGGRSQQIVYATEDGSIVSLEPVSGAAATLYEGEADRYATTPGRTGGSRGISFTVLRDDSGDDGEAEGSLRGSLYGADLVRETRALLENAAPGEALVFPDYAPDGQWIMVNRFSTDSPPNVEVFTASAATRRLLSPDIPGAPPMLGPVWTAERSIYAWSFAGKKAALTAHNFFERRGAAVYETGRLVGPASYYFDANAFVFAERPRGAGLEESRIRVLVGTGSLPISGTGGAGLYDPSPPVAFLDNRIAVVWTDGERSGVGLINPDGWDFEKTGIEVEAGSRHPRVSNDGRYVATTDASGTELTVRRMDDGTVIRRVRDLQPPDAALGRMRDAGFEAPAGAELVAPPNFSWRSFEDS